MEFLEFMHFMFDAQEKFPGLSFQTVDNLTGAAVLINIPITEEINTLLNQGREMFS